MRRAPVSLYLHVPFCLRKCLYCDFTSGPAEASVMEAYLSALTAEVREAQAWLREEGRWVRTVYVGGGTPTVLPPADLCSLVSFALAGGTGEAPEEVTVEANPGTVDAAYLTRLREAGVNRLSLGVQSLDDTLLTTLGRVHTAREAEEALGAARRAGFDNLSVDLLFGIPGQDLASLEDSLARLRAFRLPHVSAYGLTYEPGTALHAAREKGRVRDAPEDLEVAMFRRVEELLAESGLGRYEISNFARPGFECRHNLVYWRGGEYLGLGVAAHSHVGDRRWWNTSEVRDYLRCRALGVSPVEGKEVLTPQNRLAERLMLGLRMTEGVSFEDLLRLAEGAARDALETNVQTQRDRGLVEVVEGRLRLTRAGLIVANSVILDLLP